MRIYPSWSTLVASFPMTSRLTGVITASGSSLRNSAISEKWLGHFHSSLTPQEFIELRNACRKLWEDRMSPFGFFTHFHRHFGPMAERQHDPAAAAGQGFPEMAAANVPNRKRVPEARLEAAPRATGHRPS
jgi:hypothetical protein